MHSYEVFSNESACRKKVRLGLEQVSTRNLTMGGHIDMHHQMILAVNTQPLKRCE